MTAETYVIMPEEEESIEASDKAIWFVVMFVLLFLTVTGNLLTMCAILFTRKIGALISNQFVFSLALSDLLVGLAIPYHYIFSVGITLESTKETCVIRFVLVIFACASSIFNLTAIAADRYAAIVYPLEYAKYMRRKLAYGILIVGWIVTFALSTVVLLWNNYDVGDQSCSFTDVVPQNYVMFVLLPMFASVWLVIFALYLKIWRIAVKHAKKIRQHASCVITHSKYTASDWKSIQVVLLILGCFSICWLPYFVIITCYKFLQDNIPFLLYEITFTLAMANSCMNPLIYALKNSSYREAFIAMMKCKSPNLAPQSHEYVTDHTPTGTNGREQKYEKDIAIIENGLSKASLAKKDCRDIQWEVTR